MLTALKPFFRVLTLAPLLFCVAYLSFYTPKNLLEGLGFTDDLKLVLVIIGISAGTLYFMREKKVIEAYMPGEEPSEGDASSEDAVQVEGKKEGE